MKSLPQRQQGLTLLSIAFILALIAFFVLLILKIAPIYIDHSKVANALAALEKTTDIQTKSEQEVRQSLEKRLNMNYVYDVTQDDIKVIKRGNYLKVQAEYETVVKIFGNLSVLAEFNDIIEVGQE
jgi:uncharacterized membrane protein YhiD involved in acid resistance